MSSPDVPQSGVDNVPVQIIIRDAAWQRLCSSHQHLICDHTCADTQGSPSQQSSCYMRIAGKLSPARMDVPLSGEGSTAPQKAMACFLPAALAA